MRESEDIPHDSKHHEKLDHSEADDDSLNGLKGHAVVAGSPQLSIIFKREYIHLTYLYDQILDNMETEEVDEDQGTDLDFTEKHHQLKASLTVQVCMLDA